MRELLLKEELDVSLGEFFSLFMSDESTYKYDFHISRGDSEIRIGQWTQKAPNGKERIVRFHSPTSTNVMIRKIAGENVEVEEVQTLYYANDNLLIMDTISKVLGSSISESFLTTAKWEVSLLNPQKVLCKMTVWNEYKGYMFKGTVESFIAQQSLEAYQQYLKLAMERSKIFNSQRNLSLPGPSEVSEHDNMIEEEAPLSKTKKEKRPVRYESEGENTEDEYYDAEETPVIQNGSSSTNEIFREIAKLKSIIEITHTRLLGLEAAFINLQDRYLPITTKSQNIKNRLNNYFTRLDSVSQQRNREEEILNQNSKKNRFN